MTKITVEFKPMSAALHDLKRLIGVASKFLHRNEFKLAKCEEEARVRIWLEQMKKVQDELEQKTVEGVAGGGMVTAVANGKQEILSIKIEPEVVDPDDIEMLEDLIVAAVNQARERAQELADEEMKKIAGGMMPQLGEFKIPGLEF